MKICKQLTIKNNTISKLEYYNFASVWIKIIDEYNRFILIFEWHAFELFL